MEKIILNKERIYYGNLILVNQKYPLRFKEKEEALSLVPVTKEFPNILLENRTATMLSHLVNEVKCQNDIVYVSGYRTLSEQVSIYEDSLEENGLEFTKKYVALPNHSEHQTGLAIDLAKNHQEVIDFIRPDFPYTGIYKTFRNNAYKYGFVERYQKGKEKITGIGHEPWHFRYVGYPHAKIMVDNGLSLEEYTDFIKDYTYDDRHLVFEEQNQRIEIFYINLEDGNNRDIEIPKESICQISGNNVDGCVITLWRNYHGMA